MKNTGKCFGKQFVMKMTVVMRCMTAVLLWGTAIGAAQTDVMQQKWSYVAVQMPDRWYGSPETAAIAENVLLYQRNIGGWPKNIEMHHPLSKEQADSLRGSKDQPDAIFDNGATTTEMKFLARVYTKVPDERYQKAFERGLDFILTAQYPDNGGWPMFYPLRKRGYYDRITFNDDAMVNILRMLRRIWKKESEMSAILSDKTAERAKTAYDKGVRCILDCQIVKDGVKTVWCAQHDERTRQPAYGRPYEHLSFSGSESVGLTQFLMEIENPPREVQDAVHAAVKWLDAHRIRGMRTVYFTNAAGERDCRVEKDAAAPDLWARFYHIDSDGVSPMEKKP